MLIPRSLIIIWDKQYFVLSYVSVIWGESSNRNICTICVTHWKELYLNPKPTHQLIMITGICVDYLYVRQSEAVFVIEDMIQAEAKAVVMIGCTISETALPPCVCQFC